jgi:hypothetical protein
MKKFLKQKWMWLIYIVLFGALVVQRLFVFVSTTEQGFLYYKILMVMSVNSGHVPSAYLFTIASLVLNVATLIFLWFYIFNARCFSASFILTFILARIPCDLLGHSYEFNTIKALYYQSESAAISAGFHLFFWMLPSYLAMGDYVLRKLKKK